MLYHFILAVAVFTLSTDYMWPVELLLGKAYFHISDGILTKWHKVVSFSNGVLEITEEQLSCTTVINSEWHSW